MSQFVWKPEYETGNGTIDTQHKQLVELANLLHKAITRGQGKAIISEAFQALRRYTHEHFTDEEAFFELVVHSELLAKHKAEHVKLAHELEELGAEGISEGIPDALEKWVEEHLILHMMKSDQEALHAASATPRLP